MLHWCNKCKKNYPIGSFDTNWEGKPRKRCSDCNKKQRDWFNTPKGKEAVQRNNHSEKRPEIMKRHNQSDKGQARYKRFDATDKGKIAKKRSAQARYEREKNDTALYLRHKLGQYIAHALNGKKLNDIVSNNTQWKNADQLEQHFLTLMPDEMEDMPYGKKGWNVGHRIAKVWYDHTNPVDVKRCWSARNMYPIRWKKNQEDWVEIDPDQCAYVGQSRWPVAWNGKVPSEAERKAMVAGLWG